MRVFQALLIFFSCPFLSAQSLDYAAYKVFYENRQETADLSVSGNRLKVEYAVMERKGFNEAVVPSYATEYVYNRSFSEISGLKAKIAYPKSNGEYDVAPVNGITLKSDFSGSIFYSDDSYYEIAFPKVSAGSYTEIEYKMQVNEPQFYKPFYFTEYYPTKTATYTIYADTTIDLGWKLFGDQKDEIVFEKKEEKGRIKYTWTLKDVKTYQPETDDRGYLAHATHMLVYIKNYQTGKSEQAVLNSTADLFNWYQELLTKIKYSDSTSLQTLTAEITLGASSDREKAERIFYWVQDNIRYIAFEDGWRGFIPYPASEICSKRYGDCKDMAHLLFTLMQYAGLDARHSWVGTRELPYSYNDAPCPSVDNHLVLSLFIDDSIFILDATDPRTPFGVPTSFILSKETLHKSSDGSFSVYKIPEYDADFCTISDTIVANVQDNVVSGTANKTIETFEYSEFNNGYGYANIEKQKFLTSYLQLGQNNFELISSTISDVMPRSKTRIDYSYKIPAYVRKIGDSYFINLNLFQPFSTSKLAADRKYDYEIDFKKKYQTITQFTLPDGMNCKQLPAPVSRTFSVGSLSSSYIQEGNQILYTRVVKIQRLLVKPAEFAEWNNFIGALQEMYNTSIEYTEK